MGIDGGVLRDEIAALNDVKKRRRYSSELRSQLAAYARERISAGDSVRGLSRELDVSPQVIVRALASTTAIVPVKVKAATPKPSALIMRAPCGVTVEGASLDDIAGIIARLSSCSD